MTVFEAYITNLGKYAEGQLVGETLKFPATTEEVQSLLKNIGVDGVRYEEFFITAFDGDVMGLYDYLTEYENLDELNHLAHPNACQALASLIGVDNERYRTTMAYMQYLRQIPYTLLHDLFYSLLDLVEIFLMACIQKYEKMLYFSSIYVPHIGT